MYVTPERFRTMGFGANLDAYDSNNVGLRSLLTRASAKVDAALHAPMLPQRHDFRGGSITNEQQRYQMGRGPLELSQRVFFLRHTPIKAVSRLWIKATNTHYASFSQDEMFISPQLGIVEITSLATATGIFGASLIPIVGLTQPIVEVDYTYGYDFEVVDEVLEPTDARLFRAQNQWWTDDPVVVKVNDVETTTGITIDTDEGTVGFDVGLDSDDVVSASYHHRLPYEISQATGIIAADLVGQERLSALGLTGLRRMRVAEIEVEREGVRVGSAAASQPAIPPAAADLLAGLEFITVR